MVQYPVSQPVPQPFGQPGAQPVSGRSKAAAGVLSLLLGGLGAGRFYLGRPGLGVAQLMVFLVALIIAVVALSPIIFTFPRIYVMIP